MKVTSILTACFILIFGLVTSVGAISYTDARFDTEIEYSLILNSVTVGDTESGPESDILGQASAGIRTDHCLEFPA